MNRVLNNLLKVHILNVDHGDSIILEYTCEGRTSFGVIDSNIPANHTVPPALEKLQDLGAKNLSFIALTHPHLDHHLGLVDIIEAYKGKVKTFYSFPLNQIYPDTLKKIAKIYKEIYVNTDSPTLRKHTSEFARLLGLVSKTIGMKNWEEPIGINGPIYPEGFMGVEINVLLPHPKNKGPYFQMIENGDENISTSQEMNKLSLAFLVKYKGLEIILGGDATRSNWDSHRISMEKGKKALAGKIIKLPHHGSKEDCSESVLDYIFDNTGHSFNIGCISANGRSHPASEVFTFFESNNVHPYCTNLTETCRANIKQIVHSQNLDPVLNRFINLFEDHTGKAIQPCQGNIEITIEDDGSIDVSTEYSHACLFRGNFDFLNA